MTIVSGHKRAAQFLYPPLDPFDSRMMSVGDGHEIYVEQSGNPEGEPVVVLHGGPGGGCSPAMRRYFDPERYRVVLFDQRGCGKSRPHASVEANTTWHLVADIEHIRDRLGIDEWVVFGGSWGATLALIYAQTHPDRARHLVLRGVFLMTEAELDWFYGGGAGRFFPEIWDRFESAIPEHERGDMIAAYHRRLFSDDKAEQTRYAQLWAGWENALASAASNGQFVETLAHYARAFSRIEAHYFLNQGWLGPDKHILDRMDRIAQIPGLIVQGRLDMICPPQAAVSLAAAWPKARLQMVPASGHAMSEPQITKALIAEMDRIADLKA